MCPCDWSSDVCSSDLQHDGNIRCCLIRVQRTILTSGVSTLLRQVIGTSVSILFVMDSLGGYGLHGIEYYLLLFSFMWVLQRRISSLGPVYLLYGCWVSALPFSLSPFFFLSLSLPTFPILHTYYFGLEGRDGELHCSQRRRMTRLWMGCNVVLLGVPQGLGRMFSSSYR